MQNAATPAAGRRPDDDDDVDQHVSPGRQTRSSRRSEMVKIADGACEAAARGGHLHVLQWIMRATGYPTSCHDDDDGTPCLATRRTSLAGLVLFQNVCPMSSCSWAFGGL
jgi:hypothetical protein